MIISQRVTAINSTYVPEQCPQGLPITSSDLTFAVLNSRQVAEPLLAFLAHPITPAVNAGAASITLILYSQSVLMRIMSGSLEITYSAFPAHVATPGVNNNIAAHCTSDLRVSYAKISDISTSVPR